MQTACSTSLVAVQMACQALLARQCDMALAGGAAVTVPLAHGYLHREGGILSADGHCRPFDAQAAGTVPGNGVGHGPAQAPRGCHRRRRHRARRDRGSGDQQRRRGQDRLHRAERVGAGRGDRAGPRPRGRARRDHRLRRGARHRHAARRPDRGGRAHPGLPAHVAGARLLRAGLGEGQPRPPRHRGRRDRPDQGGAGGEARRHPAQPSLRAAQSRAGARGEPVLSRGRGAALAARGTAARLRELLRHRRHQRARRDRGGPGAGARGRDAAPGAGAVRLGSHPAGARAIFATPGARARTGCRGPRRHRVHAGARAPCARAAARGGGRKHGRCRGAVARGFPRDRVPGRSPGRVALSRTGRATPGHGRGAGRPGARVRRGLRRSRDRTRRAGARPMCASWPASRTQTTPRPWHG